MPEIFGYQDHRSNSTFFSVATSCGSLNSSLAAWQAIAPWSWALPRTTAMGWGNSIPKWKEHHRDILIFSHFQWYPCFILPSVPCYMLYMLYMLYKLYSLLWLWNQGTVFWQNLWDPWSQEQLDSLTSAAKDLQQRGELQPPPEELLECGWHFGWHSVSSTPRIVGCWIHLKFPMETQVGCQVSQVLQNPQDSFLGPNGTGAFAPLAKSEAPESLVTTSSRTVPEWSWLGLFLGIIWG